MEYTFIEVPDLNDSFSRIVLQGKAYYIRFTYNHSLDYWTFGLYDMQQEPIIQGIKIVPRYSLTSAYTTAKIPKGRFGVLTNLKKIGRNAFKSGAAKFAFVSEE